MQTLVPSGCEVTGAIERWQLHLEHFSFSASILDTSAIFRARLGFINENIAEPLNLLVFIDYFP